MGYPTRTSVVVQAQIMGLHPLHRRYAPLITFPASHRLSRPRAISRLDSDGRHALSYSSSHDTIGNAPCLRFPHPRPRMRLRVAMKLWIDRSFSSERRSLVAAANARLSASHTVERLWDRRSSTLEARSHRHHQPPRLADNHRVHEGSDRGVADLRNFGQEARHPRRGPAWYGWQQLGTGSAARVFWITPRLPPLVGPRLHRSRLSSTAHAGDRPGSKPVHPDNRLRHHRSIVWQGIPETPTRLPLWMNNSCVLRLRPRHPPGQPLT